MRRIAARRYAEAQAVTNRAQGNPEREREWLDLLHLMDQDDAVSRETPADRDEVRALLREEIDRLESYVDKVTRITGVTGASILRPPHLTSAYVLARHAADGPARPWWRFWR